MSVAPGRPKPPTAPPLGAASEASVGVVHSSGAGPAQATDCAPLGGQRAKRAWGSLILEASGREPAVDLLEAIEPPERLAVDEHERRAEDAARNSAVDFALQRFLDRRVVDGRARGGAIGAR